MLLGSSRPYPWLILEEMDVKLMMMMTDFSLQQIQAAVTPPNLELEQPKSQQLPRMYLVRLVAGLLIYLTKQQNLEK